MTNEGEGVAICAGAWLAGKMPAIILETSGILLSTYALMRCHATFGIPILMLSTYRGGLGDQEWYAATHRRGAAATARQPCASPARSWRAPTRWPTTFVDARRTMNSSLHPVSIVMDVRLTTRE